MNILKIPEATKKGYAEATEGDSINLEQPNSETRRGRVGKGIAQTLTTSCNQAVVKPKIRQKARGNNLGGDFVICPTLTSNSWQENNHLVEAELIQIAQLDGFESEGRIYDSNGISRTIKNGGGGASKTGWYQIPDFRIRKLTPLECFRLQGFPDDFAKPVSNSQLYKQAGNSITVAVIQAILKNLLKNEININDVRIKQREFCFL